MLSILDRKQAKRGVVKDLYLAFLHEKLSTNIDKVISFYNRSYFTASVKGPIYNLLSLLHQQNSDGSDNTFNYFIHGKRNLEDFARATNITTHINKQKMVKNLFYGKAPTALISESRLDINYDAMDWKYLNPLRVLVCPVTKGFFTRPDLIEATNGYSIIGIDIPMLSVMYNSWMRENLLLPVDVQERPQQFLGRYVYPNMMESQADAIMVNNLNYEMTNFIDDSPKLPTDQSGVIDNTVPFVDQLLKAVRESTNKGYTMEQLAESIPSFSADSLLDSLQDPHMLETSANYWGTVMGDLPVLYALAKNTPSDPTATSVIARLRGIQRTLNSQRTFHQDIGFKHAIKTSEEIFDNLFMEINSKN